MGVVEIVEFVVGVPAAIWSGRETGRAISRKINQWLDNAPQNATPTSDEPKKARRTSLPASR